MKKRFIFFVLLFSVCIALVIPKTNAYESTYYYEDYYVGNTFDFVVLNSFISIEDDSFVSVDENYRVYPSSNINIGNYRVYKYYAGSLVQGNYLLSTKFNQFRNPDQTNTQINSIELISNEMIYVDNNMVVRSPAPFRYNYSFEFLSENGWVEISRSGNSEIESKYYVAFDFGIPEKSLLRNVSISVYNISTEIELVRFAYPDKNFIYDTLEYYESLNINIEQINPDFTSFLVNAVSGLMDFEIIPGVSFSVIFGLLIMIPILLYILKFFFGG